MFLSNNSRPEAYNIRITDSVSTGQNMLRFPSKAEKIYGIVYDILEQICQPVNITRVELDSSLEAKVDTEEKAFYLILDSFAKYIR